MTKNCRAAILAASEKSLVWAGDDFHRRTAAKIAALQEARQSTCLSLKFV
jgi:hypothetical protein